MASKAAMAAAVAMFGKQTCLSGGYRSNCPRGADCLYTHYDDPKDVHEDSDNIDAPMGTPECFNSSTPCKGDGKDTGIGTEDDDDDETFYDSCGIRTTYGKEEFERIVIPGDGYCMVNSVKGSAYYSS